MYIAKSKTKLSPTAKLDGLESWNRQK